ncbi:MAG: hypothetical protein HZA89_03080 [Verrucomicrobia bacterium]|nr:hypothetical protein [Verrucomicrobiota bacterium]
MAATITPGEEAQLMQTIEMFEVITQSQPQDYQSLEILKEAYSKLNREKDVVNTAKRIAEAYVQLGQLSSAIMEYETILQRFPNDPDVKKALEDIENRATNFAAPGAAAEDTSFLNKKAAEPAKIAMPGAPAAPATPGKPAVAGDDGREVMRKIFVEAKLITENDFNLYWPTPPTGDPGGVIEPFMQVVADKAGLAIEKSLKIVLEKSRLGYMPLEKYDVDMDLARSFPRQTCQRWCVAPFDRMSKSVLVATTNPFNKQAAAELQERTNQRLLWYLTSPADLVKVIKKIHR